MAMNDEERAEFTDTAKLLSAEELRGMLGDDAEQDAIINGILGTGKQVEVKTSDDEHPNPDEKRVEPEKKEGEDDEDEEEETPPADAKTDPSADAAAQEEAARAAAEAAAAAKPAVEIPKLDLSYLDADYKAQLAALDADKAAKFKTLMDGDLSAEDYAKAESEYFAKRDALRDDKAASAAWMTEVHNFRVQTLQSDGVNYFEPKFNDALDDWVKRLAAKPELAEVPESQILQMAHKKVMAEFDLTPAKAAPTPAPTAAPAKPNKNRAPDLSAIPPTLGGLPAAAGHDAGDDGEFSHLDNLTGMDYEKALARLSPEQKARYEAM